MHSRAMITAALLGVMAFGDMRPANAVPAFAGQTGLACSACHVGAFGPQLTPFGRAFKIRGYTMGGGTGLASEIPLSAMLQGSYTDTQENQSGPASQHYGSNGNFAMGQISIFLAGHYGDHLGALIQGTFDGIASQTFVDNADVRLVSTTKVFGLDTDIGLSLNNSPSLSDPYNSTYPNGYAFISSALSLTPTAGTILAGNLAGNSLGLDAFAWLDQRIYLDFGLYDTQAPGLMKIFGETYGPGAETGVAPYARGAYEWNWGDNNVHAGGAAFYSRFNPAVDLRSVNGSFGHDKYTDLLIDGGYQYLGSVHSVTLEDLFDYEIQDLRGSSNPFSPYQASSQPNNNLQETKHTATYYYQDTYGLTVSWDKVWGKRNQLVYNTGAPDSGSINGSPDSNSFMFEADWVPFGKDSSFGRPFANVKIGAQYTIYTEFNGSGKNYDGYGRNASDNNTLYLFIWTIF